MSDNAPNKFEGFEIGLPYFDGDGLCRLGDVTARGKDALAARDVSLSC